MISKCSVIEYIYRYVTGHRKNLCVVPFSFWLPHQHPPSCVPSAGHWRSIARTSALRMSRSIPPPCVCAPYRHVTAVADERTRPPLLPIVCLSPDRLSLGSPAPPAADIPDSWRTGSAGGPPPDSAYRSSGCRGGGGGQRRSPYTRDILGTGLAPETPWLYSL